MDRSGLKDVLVSFGAERGRIKAVSTWESAQEIIDEESIDIFFCEFNMADGVTKINKALTNFIANKPNRNENLVVILGDEKVKNLMGQIKEDWNLDFCIQRPFTGGQLKEQIVQALQVKNNFTNELKEYYELIGKLAIDMLDEDAIMYFLGNHKGAWSYYLHAKYNLSQDNIEEAEKNLYSALEIDGQHVNSLSELFNLHISNKKWDKALKSAEKLAGKNLWGRMDTEKLLMVCLALEEFEYVEKIHEYLSQFQAIDDKTANALCASAALASKSLYRHSQLDKAKSFATMAIDLNPVKKKLVVHALKTLVAMGEVDYVSNYLASLEPDEMTDEFRGIAFLNELGSLVPEEIYRKGVALINEGVVSVEIFNATIESALNLNNNPSPLVDKAVTLYPDYKEHFQSKI